MVDINLFTYHHIPCHNLKMQTPSMVSNYKQEIARIFNRVASSYDDAAVVEYEMGTRLIERLDLINLAPDTILDLGGGTGRFTQKLADRYQNAHVFYCDLSEGMAQQALSSFNTVPHSIPAFCGDAEYIPLKNNSVDFIFSNGVFQWCQDINRLFQEIARILKPGGLFLFSTFGPDTLLELQHSIDFIEHQTHHPLFIDMHILGDLMLQASLQDPVMDIDRLLHMYPTVSRLIDDLQLTGCSEYYDAISVSQPDPLNSNFLSISEKYEAFRQEGRLPATFEIIYGHAWGTETRNVPQDSDIYRIPVSTIGYS
jgi:malonyl-CoA O-methyltransferase